MLYTFHLRTVTEVFAGGADLQNAELRPSAFRGPLRFWFRAMMGKVVGNDLDALKRLETLAFGATDAGSPFQLRIKQKADNLPRGILAETADSVGYNYLAFSLKERTCLPQDTPFQAELRFRYPDPLLHRTVLGAFWLLLNFGGIGSRTRRSFGALCADRIDGEVSFDFEQPESLGEHYREGLSAVEMSFRDFADQHHLMPPQIIEPTFTTFHGWSGRIVLFWDSVFEAQECLGRILRGFRNGKMRTTAPWDFLPRDLQRNTRTRDYLDVVASYLDTGATAPQNLTNDALGLPIVFFSSTRKRMEQDADRATPRADPPYKMRPWTATTQWKLPQEQEWHHDRRASPLILRPIKMRGGRFAALIAAFPCEFLPMDLRGRPSQEQLKPGGPSRSKTRSYSPLPIQVCTQDDVKRMVGFLFEQIDRHFDKDSVPLP